MYIPTTTLTQGGTGFEELDYVEITSQANITDTAEDTATALITCNSISVDGSTVILLEFFTPYVGCPTGAVSNVTVITLFEGATEIGRLAHVRSVTTTTQNRVPCHAAYRFTPSNGSHTYKICGFVSATTGTPHIMGGSGGTGGDLPAFVRITTC